MSEERKTIVLVDDDVTNLTIAKNSLSSGYNIITLNSGLKLIRLLERQTPDLILLDVEMPEINGYETIKLLKANAATHDIPVIFLTAKSDSDSEYAGLSLGAIDYIIKPFSPPLLLKRIEVHLLVEAQRLALLEFNQNLQSLVEAKTRSVIELQNAILKTMSELVEYRDNITGGHIERTQSYLRVLVDEIVRRGVYADIVSKWDLTLLLQSAQLHDVGKIAIRDDILLKPGRLSFDEYEKIKVHAAFGEHVIEKIIQSTTDQAFLEHARIFAGTHHERWDGTGYPLGLKGEEIPLQGRLMAIADVYDALVSSRPYKNAFTHEEARDIIVSGRGTHFDPILVDVFQDVSEEFRRISDGQVE
ncbi:MAG: response regulator [Oscillospiraceae bacterium]|nr:response regulator [Oscillospiraceae bacterium]